MAAVKETAHAELLRLSIASSSMVGVAAAVRSLDDDSDEVVLLLAAADSDMMMMMMQNCVCGQRRIEQQRDKNLLYSALGKLVFCDGADR